jgi:hypothetical protein
MLRLEPRLRRLPSGVPLARRCIDVYLYAYACGIVAPFAVVAVVAIALAVGAGIVAELRLYLHFVSLRKPALVVRVEKLGGHLLVIHNRLVLPELPSQHPTRHS